VDAQLNIDAIVNTLGSPLLLLLLLFSLLNVSLSSSPFSLLPSPFSLLFFFFQGGEFIVDVIDVQTQEAESMTLGDFSAYWKTPQPRARTLNIISLPVSSTHLGKLITPPNLVTSIDWVEMLASCCFDPEAKVDKYVLMSSKDSFTNFHVDFGGSSVWLFIAKGHKTFYLIPPTDENLRQYEEWRDENSDEPAFWGDLVDICYELHLDEGQVLLIPGGWIHAVFTPVDTISISGKFLHSFNISLQLGIQKSEKRRREKDWFRFPCSDKLNSVAGDHHLRQLVGLSAFLPFSPPSSFLFRRPCRNSADFLLLLLFVYFLASCS